MPELYKNLFYLNQIKGSDNERLIFELEKCNFSNKEAKKILYLFFILAKIKTIAKDEEEGIRWLRGEMKWTGFNSIKLKPDEGRIIVKFYNHLVSFRNGNDSSYTQLVECIKIDELGEKYDFSYPVPVF